jgi:hypothetical protein
VILILTIAYSPPMGPLGMVIVPPMNKKEDPAVEIWKLSIKNNVILLLNVVKILSVVTLMELVLVSNEPQTNKITLFATSIVMIAIFV